MDAVLLVEWTLPQPTLRACDGLDTARAGQLVQMAAEQIEKAASGYQQRQAVNNGDLFAF